MRFETKTIHSGQKPDPQTGAVIVPIYQTSTYAQPAVGQHLGHEYTRTSNPTRDALQTCLASLESAKHGIAFASGMAAVSTMMTLFQSGDHIVCTDDIYGGTFRVFEKVFTRFGLRYSFVDTGDLEALDAAIEDQTRLVMVESPTNPLLRITDIRAVAELCKRRELLFAVDNTFMSPAFQRPIELGADLVLHSTTKYIGGHSDVVGGAIITDRDDLHKDLSFTQNSMGAVPGPFDSWLTLRGLKTLALRMRKHEENALEVARHLEAHAEIENVIYPGLESHPGHAIHKGQSDGSGGVISFCVKGGLDAAKRVCERTHYFILAESLGGVESLIEHPGIMTHASVPKEQREARGISDGLVRISVGIEDVRDLIEDLDQALKPE